MVSTRKSHRDTELPQGNPQLLETLVVDPAQLTQWIANAVQEAMKKNLCQNRETHQGRKEKVRERGESSQEDSKTITVDSSKERK